MAILRQALRAIHESYRFIRTKPRSPLCSILRLWLAGGSVLFFWLLTTNISRSAEDLLNTPSMIVVIRGNTPGMAVLGDQIAVLPGVKDVQYRLRDEITSTPLNNPLPGIVPSFWVDTRSNDPDTVAMVATRVRQIDDVLDVLYSRKLLERSSDLLRWVRWSTRGFGVIVLGLVLVVVAWEMKASGEQRKFATAILWRLGASRLFIAVPAAIVGGLNGFAASCLGLWSVLRLYEVVVDLHDIPETLTTPERVGFLIGGAILGSGANFGVMMLRRTGRQSK